MVAPLPTPMGRKRSWKPLKRVLIEKLKRSDARPAPFEPLPPNLLTFPPFTPALRRMAPTFDINLNKTSQAAGAARSAPGVLGSLLSCCCNCCRC